MTRIHRPSSKDAIIDAGFAVFNQDPSASLSQVAARAGVGRATLHRYFASRDALLQSLSQIAIQEMDAVVDAACADLTSYGEAVRVSLDVLIPLGDRYGFLLSDAVVPSPEMQAEFTRQRKETEAMIAGAQDEGVFDAAIPTSWIVQAYDFLLAAAWESVKADEITRKQAATLAWRTLMSGLGKGLT